MRVLPAILAAAMILALTACEGAENGENVAPSAYEKYVNACERLDEAGSMGTNTYTKMSVYAAGEELILEMTGTVKTIAQGESDMEMDALLFVNLSDGSGRYGTGWQHIYMAYYKDGHLYSHFQEMVSMYEVKTKIPVPAEEATMQVSVFEPIKFAESAVNDAVESDAVTEPDNVFSADSGTVLRFSIDAAALSETLEAIVYSKLGVLYGELDGLPEDFVYGELVLTVLLDEDDGMSGIDMVFPIESTVYGLPMSAEIEMRMTISQIGNVIIDFPDDLDTYELMSEDTDI